MKNKTLIPTIILTLLFTLAAFDGAGASIGSLLEAAGESGGAGFRDATSKTAPEFLGKMVQYILAFLGVTFLILLIYGGFLWMTARGDEEQITKAKDIMINAVIGLIIVLMSYAVTFYIVSKAMSTTIETGVSGF